MVSEGTVRSSKMRLAEQRDLSWTCWHHSSQRHHLCFPSNDLSRLDLVSRNQDRELPPSGSRHYSLPSCNLSCRKNKTDPHHRIDKYFLPRKPSIRPSDEISKLSPTGLSGWFCKPTHSAHHAQFYFMNSSHSQRSQLLLPKPVYLIT